MVCGRCSLPLGPGARQASSGLRRLNPLGSGGRGDRRNWLMPVAVLLILSALLAWLSEQPQPRQIPFGQEQNRLR
jgi:hypothetical protein